MKKIILGFLLLLIPVAAKAQSTYTAASCSQADIGAKVTQELASPVDGDVIAIPAGNCVWSGASSLTMSFVTSVTIQGAGAISATTSGASTTGADNTIITDHFSGSNSLWVLSCAAGKTCRVTGVAFFEDGSSGNESQGLIQVTGPWTSKWRIDHLHLTLKGGAGGIGVYGAVIGVADHNYISGTAPNIVTNDFVTYNGVGWNGASSSDAYGHASWSDTDHWGSNLFFFIEDNRLVDSDVLDSHVGGRYVLRHNTMFTSAQGHGSEAYWHSFDAEGRAGRAAEVYSNTATVAGNGAGNAFFAMNGGTALCWGNTVNGYVEVVGIDDTRRGNGSSEIFGPPPTSVGNCGGAPATTGTASVAANGTTVTGSGFSTSWPVGSIIYLIGASCTVSGNISPACAISSVQSSTSLTLSTPSTLAVTNGSYSVGSSWDGNFTAYGYPCLDHVGRGTGDLLSGIRPNMLNSTTGTVAWAHQVLSPVYVWNNTFTPATGYSPSYMVQNVAAAQSPSWTFYAANRDYYQQFSTPGESGSFDGTRGVGQGLLSARPATCTAGTDLATGGSASGVGYWATDNTTLYVCNPTNTWTAYYTPYTYPHPLVSGQVDTPTFSPVAGSYVGTQNVTISTTTGGATICYTTDGSIPTADGAGTCTHGTTYSTPVVVASTLTIKAVGSLSGSSDSVVGSAAYTIGAQVATPTYSPVGGTYLTAQNVTISTSTGGATICYTTDGSTPTANGAGTCTHGTTYSTPVAVTLSLTLKAIGSLSGDTDSSLRSDAYFIGSTRTAPSIAIMAGKGH